MLSSDAFTVINTALIQSGNQPVVVAFDGTDEWLAGFNAYQLWLPYCIEARDWNFQTAVAALTRVGGSDYPRFSDAYAFPANCAHLQTVWRTDLAAQQPAYLGWGMTRDGIIQPQIEYRIIGNQIHTSAPQGLTAKYLTAPQGKDRYTATFNIALITFVASSLFGSLNEDLAAQDKTMKLAQEILEEAAVRSDQQENRRVAFRSRMIERRRARWAPWGTTY
jgi:hypothetical protein